ncbi:hypothetical protein [Paraliobacillus zengyii]|uniref:hypothetical protein n=1 Tax=Paraliobacillus zengyii TaxID=2213194 RepID=UPI000DD3CD25|nr:hypothetical protein [Paraliobacillus zengyii]
MNYTKNPIVNLIISILLFSFLNLVIFNGILDKNVATWEYIGLVIFYLITLTAITSRIIKIISNKKHRNDFDESEETRQKDTIDGNKRRK